MTSFLPGFPTLQKGDTGALHGATGALGSCRSSGVLFFYFHRPSMVTKDRLYQVVPMVDSEA